MQVIEKNDKPFKLIADEGMKLTKNREFFVKTVYLSINDKVENYEEVPYEVWGLFLDDEIPKNKVEELTAKIKNLEEEKAELKDKLLEVEKEHGDYLLDNDLRITMLELGLAYINKFIKRKEDAKWQTQKLILKQKK